MSIVILVPFLVGAALGMRFKVLVLVPAILLTLMVVLVAGLASSSSFAANVIEAAISAISLQFGYLSAILARYSMAREAGALAEISHSAYLSEQKYR